MYLYSDHSNPTFTILKHYELSQNVQLLRLIFLNFEKKKFVRSYIDCTLPMILLRLIWFGFHNCLSFSLMLSSSQDQKLTRYSRIQKTKIQWSAKNWTSSDVGLVSDLLSKSAKIWTSLEHFIYIFLCSSLVPKFGHYFVTLQFSDVQIL